MSSMIVSQQQELAHQISSLVQMEGASLRDGVVIETMTVVITLMNVAAHVSSFCYLNLKTKEYCCEVTFLQLGRFHLNDDAIHCMIIS